MNDLYIVTREDLGKKLFDFRNKPFVLDTLH